MLLRARSHTGNGPRISTGPQASTRPSICAGDTTSSPILEPSPRESVGCVAFSASPDCLGFAPFVIGPCGLCGPDEPRPERRPARAPRGAALPIGMLRDASGGPVDDRERVGRRHRPRPAHGGSRSAIAEPTGRGESHRGRGRDHGCLVHRAGELRCRRLQPCTCERLTE